MGLYIKRMLPLPNGVPEFPIQGITFHGGGPIYGERPTKDWIVNPSSQDIELFLWFLLCNVASRPPAEGGHQTLPMRGNFCTYGFPTPGIRESDLSRRIYAGVRFLEEIAGEKNAAACGRVRSYVGGHFGKTERGRKRKTSRQSDIFDEVQILRSIYNHAKDRHRWKEKLPERDLELEHWWGLFLHFKEWAQRRYYLAVEESDRRGISIDDFCNEYQARFGSLGRVVSSVVKKIREIRGD